MTTLYDHLLKKQRKQRSKQKARARIARLPNAKPVEPEEQEGIDDLPDEIAIAIAATPITQPPSPQPARKAQPSDSVENLVRRMTAIKNRIFWLRSVFATTLSQECAIEANNFLQISCAILFSPVPRSCVASATVHRVIACGIT